MANAITQYSLSGIKTFTGMEGYGLNANLLLDGKKIAFILDDGNGGMLRIDYAGKDYEQRKKVEADFHAALVAVYDHAAYVKYMVEEIGADAKDVGTQSPSDMAETWINQQADAAALSKRLKSLAKKHTLFRLTGDKPIEWRTVKNHIYGPASVDFIKKKYGGKVLEIYNPAAA